MSGIVTTKKQALAYLKATRERYGLLQTIQWLIDPDPDLKESSGFDVVDLCHDQIDAIKTTLATIESKLRG